MKCRECGHEKTPDDVSIVRYVTGLPSPFPITKDCSDEKFVSRKLLSRPRFLRPFGADGFDIQSFCNSIYNAVPKAVRDGRFLHYDSEDDQSGMSDTVVPISIAPPKDIKLRSRPLYFKPPKLKVPNMDVPVLKPRDVSPAAPKIIPSRIYLPSLRYSEEDSSAERIEIFKKGIKKLLQFVKVLGKIDEYLSERTRIIITKLAQTFSD